MRQELELYIHIPFCVKKCNYCDFLSGPAGREVQEQYVEALCKEICAGSCGEEYIVTSIFLGGGTPSILPETDIERIMRCIYETYQVDGRAEITIEANPGTVDEKKLKTYVKAGINRISFGCQSADNQQLRELGRIHTWGEFLESFRLARKAGFTNINVDLISGLPNQDEQSWENTLKKVAELEPEHISAYSLIIEEGTPFASKKLNLPDEEEERLMYERTHEIMESYGFFQYEISNYAKTGMECKHNIGYWKRKEYLGMGLGSSSLIKETRFSNTTDMAWYIKESSQPDRIREQKEDLNEKQQMEEFMFLGLRLQEGISEREFLGKFSQDINSVYQEVIEKYCKMGFLKREHGNIAFTRKGVSVSNWILADFLLE